MIIGFSVTNFRSFLSRQSCSFLASYDRTHESTHCIATDVKGLPRLTKTAVIFGPNASGKSNFLIALRTMRELVLHSTSYSDTQYQRRYTPFLLDDSDGQPTTFEVDVLLDGTRFRYGFSYDAGRIVSEQLLVSSKGRSQRWVGRSFDTQTQTEHWAPFSASFTGPREMWRKATRRKALFLTTAAQLNSADLKPLFHWFEHQLEIVLSSDTAELKSFAARIKDARFKQRILRILRAADIGVEDIRVTEVNGESPIRANLAPFGTVLRHTGESKIEFLHARVGAAPVWLDSTHESAGTHRVVTLLTPLLDAIQLGKLIAIDEFDSTLHPLVARLLIGLITDPTEAGHEAQLLLSSHNVTLMDLDILRRDEIWLMHLDKSRASNLSMLLQQSPRKHEMVAKAYLRGRYGAVPHIGLKH